jgi:hypothetical protein
MPRRSGVTSYDGKRLYHTHTRERLDVVYRRGSDYVPEALVRVDRFCGIIAPATCITMIRGCWIC